MCGLLSFKTRQLLWITAICILVTWLGWSAYQPQVTLESRRKHPSQEVVRNSDSPNQLFRKNHRIGWKHKESCCFDFFCTNKDHIKLFDRCAISLHIPFQHFPQEHSFPNFPNRSRSVAFRKCSGDPTNFRSSSVVATIARPVSGYPIISASHFGNKTPWKYSTYYKHRCS